MKHLVLLSLLFSTSMMLAKPRNVLLSYGDGSGNGYDIFIEGKKKYIEYNPMTPEMSSSGIYSGGEYKKKAITTKEYLKIKSLASKAEKEKQDHAKMRSKGTGIITFTGEKRRKRLILKMGSKSKNDFESALKELLTSHD